MAEKKITDLDALTAVAPDDYLEIVDTSESASKKISRENLTGWHFLTTPLASISWNGDSFSTTSKTKIDLSDVFGAPPGIKVIIAEVSIRDSGSAGTLCRLVLSANDVSMSGAHALTNYTNDGWNEVQLMVPCDANGDIYYQIVASGTSTFEAYLTIICYWI